MKKKTVKNLGPIDDKPCATCGRRHHQYAWPQKCYDADVRADHKSELAADRANYAKMSQVEKDAHDNL